MSGGRVGDAWYLEPQAEVTDAPSPADIPHDDASYSGEVSVSPLSLDYYRTKANEFQTVLNALDSAYQTALGSVYFGLDPESEDAILAGIAEYESKKYLLRTTAEAINLGASIVNGMGGRFPSLSIPPTLGVPFLLPAAVVAAIATAGTLAVWGREWISGMNARLENAQIIAAADDTRSPEVKAQVLQSLAQGVAITRAAKAQAESSGFSALAPLLKWGGFAILAFVAYRALAPLLKGGRRSLAAD